MKPEPSNHKLPVLAEQLRASESELRTELSRQFSKKDLIALEKRKNRDVFFNRKPVVPRSPVSKIGNDNSRLSLNLSSKPSPFLLRSSKPSEGNTSKVTLAESEVNKVRRRVMDEYFRDAKLGSSEQQLREELHSNLNRLLHKCEDTINETASVL